MFDAEIDTFARDAPTPEPERRDRQTPDARAIGVHTMSVQPHLDLGDEPAQGRRRGRRRQHLADAGPENARRLDRVEVFDSRPRHEEVRGRQRFQPEARFRKDLIELLSQLAPGIELDLQQAARVQMHAGEAGYEMHRRGEPGHATSGLFSRRA